METSFPFQSIQTIPCEQNRQKKKKTWVQSLVCGVTKGHVCMGSTVPGCYGWCRKDRWGWSYSSSCTTSLPCKPWHSGSPEDQGSCPKLRMDDRYGTSLSHLTEEEKDDFPPLLQPNTCSRIKILTEHWPLLSFSIYDFFHEVFARLLN